MVIERMSVAMVIQLFVEESMVVFSYNSMSSNSMEGLALADNRRPLACPRGRGAPWIPRDLRIGRRLDAVELL